MIKDDHLQYWFNPVDRNLYCLGCNGHETIVDLEYFNFNSENLEAFEIIDKVIDQTWVRMVYSPKTMSLSLQCLKNKNAISAIRAFENKEHFPVISAFFDIKDRYEQVTLNEEQFLRYTKFGSFR